MITKKHRLIVYGVSVQLLLVAIVCYAAFPVPVPEEPIRLMYHTNAGKVLFDHQIHATAKGYSLACTDCHHLHGDEEIEPVSCGMCHPPRSQGAKIPDSCMDCHEDAAEIESPEIMKRSDAMHKQCIGCHDQYGKGPQSGADYCGKCHVM